MDITTQQKIHLKADFNGNEVKLTAVGGDCSSIDIDRNPYSAGATWDVREASDTVAVTSVDNVEQFTLTTPADADKIRVGETLKVTKASAYVGAIVITSVNNTTGVCTYNYGGSQEFDYAVAVFDTLVIEADPLLLEDKCKLMNARNRNAFICKGTDLYIEILNEGNII